MFKVYQEISDVVSLLVYSPSDSNFLLMKTSSGELWIPSLKTEKSCWQTTANQINYEIFGTDAPGPVVPLRVIKLWLPSHRLPSVYHVVYKVAVKAEQKKKRLKSQRLRLQWLNSAELDKNRAHNNLKSPEVALFVQMVFGEPLQDAESMAELDTGMLAEIFEDTVLVGGGEADASGDRSINSQLLLAARYNKEDQILLYREFMVMVFPALYMSQQGFTQFMVDLGFQRAQCPGLFRAADVTGRGGLSFLELVLWSAALEPVTHHSGISAEIRCRYIFRAVAVGTLFFHRTLDILLFRYYDTNKDQKLEYLEFKELVAATRVARNLPVDGLSVARDADLCLRQLGLQPNSQIPLTEFLRGVGELKLRGTSSLLRSPRSIIGYITDLRGKDRAASVSGSVPQKNTAAAQSQTQGCGMEGSAVSSARRGALPLPPPLPRPDYSIAACCVRVHHDCQNEMIELKSFDDDVVSASTTRLLQGVTSLSVLGPNCDPVEATAAVHYFATAIEKTPQRRSSVPPLGSPTAATLGKAAYAWSTPAEEAAMGQLLLRMAEVVQQLCAKEPRMLRISSPVYAVGDLHGNLAALLSLEAALWPAGAALAPARLLFLGDLVDRGPHGTELMGYLFAAKIQRPSGVLLLRGNHEARDIQKMFTFHTECLTKYGEQGEKIWDAINQVFDVLPVAALVDDKVFCCHGGIPPPWVCPLITAIDKVPTPLPRPSEQSSIAWELLWNDPVKPNKITATLSLELTANEGFAANAKRGTGHVFDQLALDRFLSANNLSHVVRAHELHQNGFMCHLRGRLISVFSSSHYCGGTNESGVALLDGGKVRLIQVTGHDSDTRSTR